MQLQTTGTGGGDTLLFETGVARNVVDGCCCGEIECCGRRLPRILFADITIDSDCSCASWYPTVTIQLEYQDEPVDVNRCFEWFGTIDLCTVGGVMQTLWIGVCCKGETSAVDVYLETGGCAAAGDVDPAESPAPQCDPTFENHYEGATDPAFHLGGCCDDISPGANGRIVSVVVYE